MSSDQHSKDAGDSAKEAVDKVAGAGMADQVEGSFKQALGETQEEAGKILSDPHVKESGLEKKFEGKVQESVGDAKEGAETMSEKFGDFVDDAKDALEGLGNRVKDVFDRDRDDKDKTS